MIITPYADIWGADSVASSLTIDADGEYVCHILSALQAMTITDIAFRTGPTVTTGDNLDVRVETVDTATGLPTGTLWATNTNILVNAAAANTRYNGTLTASAALAAGDIFAIKIVRPASGTFNGGVHHRASGITVDRGFPYLVNNTGTPTKVIYSEKLALEVLVSGNTYPFLGIPAKLTADASESFSSASTPDERGSRLWLPGGWVTAFMVGINSASTACDFVLYDLNDNVIVTANWDLDVLYSTATVGVARIPCTRTLISAGEYRAVVKPGATSVTIGVTTALTDGAIREQMLQGGLNIQYTSRTNAGAWTDDTTTLARITVEMDIHEGLRRHPGMTGGVSA